MNEVSVPDEGLSETGKSEREVGKSSVIVEWVFACWRNKAEIELEVDLVREINAACNGLDLKS